jgi:hypothetical protein
MDRVQRASRQESPVLVRDVRVKAAKDVAERGGVVYPAIAYARFLLPYPLAGALI